MVSNVEMDTAATRIVIVDDHPLMRDGLAARIETEDDMLVCGEAGTISEAKIVIKAESPDLLLVDIHLPDGNGLDLVKELRSNRFELKILIISASDVSVYGEIAMTAGANGYLNKRHLQDNLLTAIRTVVGGQVWLGLISGRSHHNGEILRSLAKLTR